MAKQKLKINDKIISATFKLAETTPWHAITMDKIAKAANIKDSTLNDNFSSRLSILSAFNHQLDEQTMKTFSEIKSTESIRDQIFEMLMDRFDSLEPYKIALSSIYKETVPNDLQAGYFGFNHLRNTMRIILNIVGIPSHTPLGRVKINVLGVIFFRSFKTWLKDESSDKAQTMAILDKDLAKVEAIGEGLNNCQLNKNQAKK